MLNFAILNFYLIKKIKVMVQSYKIKYLILNIIYYLNFYIALFGTINSIDVIVFKFSKT